MAPNDRGGSKSSNVSMLERLSCNIYITNFPKQLSAKELWHTCAKFDTVLDIYIPNKVSKQVKLPLSLALIRDTKPSSSSNLASNKPLNVPKPSFVNVAKVQDKVVWIDVEGTPLRAWSQSTFNKIASRWGELVYMDDYNDSNKYSMRLCVKTMSQHLTAESFKVILKCKVSVIRAKEVTGWANAKNDDDDEVIHDSFQSHDNEVFNVEGDANEANYVEKTQEQPDVPSGDLFRLEDLILNSSKKCTKVAEETNSSEPKFPPGFTHLTPNHPKNAATKETKMVSFDIFVVRAFWGNTLFDFATSSARGRSSGNLCVWDKSLFQKKRVFLTDYCLCVEGTWLANNSDILLMSIYSPQEFPLNRELWGNMVEIINRWHGKVIAMGDFNVVRYASERYGSSFHSLNANEFNRFIANSHLIKISLCGYSFTWSDKHASKMSKLDRFLVSQGTLDLFLNLLGLILHRYISDHRSIILKESHVDYGPIPFRLFHSSFLEQDFSSVIEDFWNNDGVYASNAMVLLKNKIKFLKQRLKMWSKDKKSIMEHDRKAL
nr:RNA-directed DNA polymerase, eukaryota [Tanacetum cinerariifolium]